MLKTFDAVDENIDLMKSIQLTLPEQRLLVRPLWNLSTMENQRRLRRSKLLTHAGYSTEVDLWTTFNVVQENVIRGDSWQNAKGKVARTREVTGIDGDIKLNQVLWKMAEEFAKLKA